jgi:hypothetical protein
MFSKAGDNMSSALVLPLSINIRGECGKFVWGDAYLPAVAIGDTHDFNGSPLFIARAERAGIEIFRKVLFVFNLPEFIGPFGAFSRYDDPFPCYQI